MGEALRDWRGRLHDSGRCVRRDLVLEHYNEVLGIYSIVIMMSGCLSGLAGRNAGRPWIVFAQSLGLALPLAIAAMMLKIGATSALR